MAVALLPDLTTLDAATLREMVLKQYQQISSHSAEIERLRLIIARLQRLQFGRKSEKIQRQLDQLELQLEDLETCTAEEQQQAEQTRPDEVSVKAAASKPRRALPEHLPREVQTHAPQQNDCPPAAAHSANWVKTYPKCSSTYRHASKSFAMCGPN
jgi:transposase